ncbi:MAG: DUF2069 domain-containing protein [Gammaproteobacteria bacterium]|nr:DUF2069 domain-containing protein [Gammaproteobacteria bacterium]
MNLIAVFRGLSLFGYFGLILIIFCWHLWIDPLPAEFISITLLMQLGPLMFPLKGILNGKAYTHAWASYLALFYFVIGVWYGAVEDSRLFGILISLFSLVFFIGAIFFSRYQGMANKIDTTKNGLNQ